METTQQNELRLFVEDTAREAGSLVLARFGNVREQREKCGRGDVVTEADIESEKAILRRIGDAFPADGIVSEEAGTTEGTSGRFWLVDPLDGTRNFAIGIPFFGISIALVEGTSPLAGVVYDPVHDEMFSALRGAGALLNGRTLRVVESDQMDDALVSVCWLRRRASSRQFIGYLERFAAETSYFRRLGSAALVCGYVAAGRLDAYMQGAINGWDVAAGTLIVEEAGGFVTDFSGAPLDLSKPTTDILAANPAMHSRILREVVRSDPQA